MKSAMCCAALGAVLCAGSAQGAVVRVFELGDHPDGSASPPPYGLRLDGLFSGNSNDQTTFSFELGGAEMLMTITDSTMDGGGIEISLSGTVYGGEIQGGAYIAPALYEVDFSYTVGVQEQANGWKVTGNNPANNGTIQLAGSNDPEDVLTITDDENNSFVFLADGHRIGGDSSTFVGRGWLTPDGDGDGVPGNQDWLFTATERVIPTPGASALVLVAGVLAGKRRRN